MKCPFCGHLESKVVDSRPTDEGSTIRRRRECMECKQRFTSYERIEEMPIMVIKKDGNRQLFDRNKILNGIIKSCEKRPVSIDSIEKAVDNIEDRLNKMLTKEIPSTEVGELVMDELKKLDEVAYIRFASVYRQFKDVESFFKELEDLIHNKK